MTATVLDHAPTIHRRRTRRQAQGPTLAQVEFAARTVDELAAHRPVYVTVEGERGGGWCITAVDVYAFTYTVWRDKRELTAEWAAVSQ